MKLDQQVQSVYFTRHNIKNQRAVALLERHWRIAIQFTREAFHNWDEY